MIEHKIDRCECQLQQELAVAKVMVLEQPAASLNKSSLCRLLSWGMPGSQCQMNVQTNASSLSMTISTNTASQDMHSLPPRLRHLPCQHSHFRRTSSQLAVMRQKKLELAVPGTHQETVSRACHGLRRKRPKTLRMVCIANTCRAVKTLKAVMLSCTSRLTRKTCCKQLLWQVAPAVDSTHATACHA